MNKNRVEMNDEMMEQVNGGYFWEPTTWVHALKDGQPAEHLKLTDYGVEIEEHTFSPNVYKINGTEVSFKNAYEYAKARCWGTI